VGRNLQDRGVRRSATRRACLLRAAVLLSVTAVALGGCSEEAKRLGMPEQKSTQGEHVLSLWQGAWIAALITGGVVWGLIFFCVIAFRRRSEDEIPVQTRYNLPLEIFYTIAPVIMVVVFFSHTVRTQDIVLEDSGSPDSIIEVTAQQWTWTFNYGLGDPDPSADDDRADDRFAYDEYVYEGGTGSYIPELWLPVGEEIRFNLHSPDVIHDFGVPSFGMRMDAVPGRVNHYVITTTETGVFRGACYELCGTYHSRMLFEVHVVSREDYEAHLAELEQAEGSSPLPLLGGSEAYTQDGLEPGEAPTPEQPNDEEGQP
jgi:cytochrome c oxidase subunit 2